MQALRTESSEEDDRYVNINNDPKTQLLIDVIRVDTLRVAENAERQQADRCIILAAKLISPVIDTTYAAGCDWCIDVISPTW